jgi:hypothetical protein
MELAILNLPSARFRVKNTENRTLIWDNIRKKYLPLTSEEWVRQHFVHYLVHHCGVRPQRILLEKKVMTAMKASRFDIAVVNSDRSISLIVECKASEISLNEDAIAQLLRYAYELKSRYLALTNGMQHFYFEWDSETLEYHQINSAPTLV